jgi:hypothetical protein
MSRYSAGDRVYITLNDSGRQGTVRSRVVPPPLAAEGSGPWYLVRWDAMPDKGHPVQDCDVEECNIARVRP